MLEAFKWYWRNRKIYHCHRLYPTSRDLDIILSRSLDTGIKSLSKGHYYLDIEFNNGLKGIIWNANFPHGWLSQGKFGDFHWGGGMPSRKTSARLNNAMDKFIEDAMDILNRRQTYSHNSNRTQEQRVLTHV